MHKTLRRQFERLLTGRLKTIVVLVSPDKTEDDRRILISPNKILTEINAKILEGVATGIPTVQLAARLYLPEYVRH
ncbi:hypothetical protein GCM10010399_74600 [Dactylosporangium fulvum]